MSVTPLKQQLLNYTVLFRQLFSDYYQHQKKLFWFIQLLMVVSTLTGIFWILSIILGVSHYQNPEQVTGIKYLLFAWVFKMPLWQWLILASIAGVISAWTLFLSIQFGVKSVLAYQENLSKRCLRLVSDDRYDYWTQEFEQMPRQVLIRILRQGIQLCGLVARRITRTFVSLIVFIMAFVVLIYLDAKLLMLLLPFSLFYIIALYFINRYAARVSTELADTLSVSNRIFGRLLNSLLNKQLTVDSDQFKQQFDDSLYMHQAELKYKRRLAEIHVDWLNTLFLVIGIAVIIVYIVYVQASSKIDWQNLLFFLIALKYAASGLQQISATTVAFSRFMPEIQLVYRLLNVVNLKPSNEKFQLNHHHAIIYVPGLNLDQFEIQQIKNVIEIKQDATIKLTHQIRDPNIIVYFKNLFQQKNQDIIVDNNITRLKRTINNNKDIILPVIPNVVVFSSQLSEIQNLTLDEFLDYSEKNENFDVEDDLDAFI
ncbi:MAG: hypothetical protein AB8B80_12980 [Marinicellaceae bacterium]